MDEVRTITPRSPLWPAELSHIDAPPQRLWIRGRPEALAAGPRVAVVGSRAPTPYGEAQARRFAGAFAAAGVTVVSGLARGVDARAHEAALELGGRTIAVLGCGVDRPWPGGPLADRVAREGLLLSELEPGSGPRRHHFPRRNRLISGLSSAVVVVEAAHASGSLITAHWAADQGRAVYALPGRVDHPMARGCHRLLREGATLVESPEEVLAELGLVESGLVGAGLVGVRAGGPGSDARAAPRAAPRADPLGAAILAALRGETLTVDEVAAGFDRPVAEVLAALVGLELSGRVVRSPGGLFRLAVDGG